MSPIIEYNWQWYMDIIKPIQQPIIQDTGAAFSLLLMILQVCMNISYPRKMVNATNVSIDIQNSML